MKCVAIGGEPATGKTTLVKEILKDQQMQDYKFGLLRGHLIESFNLLVLGIFFLHCFYCVMLDKENERSKQMKQ